MAGFASLCFTTIKPIFDFGVFSSFGVAVAWLCSLFLVPALILIRGPGPEARGGSEAQDASEAGSREDAELASLEHDASSRGVAKAFMPLVSKPKTLIGISALVLVVSILGMRLLVVDNNMISFFNGRTDISKSDRFLREEFAGTKILSIVISGKGKGAMNDPAALRAMDDIAAFVAKDPTVGKVMSYTQLVKRMNQVLNVGEPAEGVRTRVSAPAPPRSRLNGRQGTGLRLRRGAGAQGDEARRDEGGRPPRRGRRGLRESPRPPRDTPRGLRPRPPFGHRGEGTHRPRRQGDELRGLFLLRNPRRPGALRQDE